MGSSLQDAVPAAHQTCADETEPLFSSPYVRICADDSHLVHGILYRLTFIDHRVEGGGICPRSRPR